MATVVGQRHRSVRGKGNAGLAISPMQAVGAKGKAARTPVAFRSGLQSAASDGDAPRIARSADVPSRLIHSVRVRRLGSVRIRPVF
jgi:hypothetical protein